MLCAVAGQADQANSDAQRSFSELTACALCVCLCVQILGGWTVLAILCASMSTATGAILATSTVMAHNVFRKASVQQLQRTGGFPFVRVQEHATQTVPQVLHHTAR